MLCILYYILCNSYYVFCITYACVFRVTYRDFCSTVLMMHYVLHTIGTVYYVLCATYFVCIQCMYTYFVCIVLVYRIVHCVLLCFVKSISINVSCYFKILLGIYLEVKTSFLFAERSFIVNINPVGLAPGHHHAEVGLTI